QVALGDDWDSLYLGNPGPFMDVYTGIIPDFGALDTTRFGEGTKDIDDIPDWAWQALPPNDKVDITNGQAALYSPGASTYLYMAVDRFANEGDAAIGLWLLQDSSVAYLPGGDWSGQHVAGIPGDTALVDPRGDILILAHFTKGGSVDSIAVFEWVGSGGNADDSLGNQGADQFDIIFKDATTAFASVNQDTTHAPWPYLSKYGDTATFPVSTFFEGALDLSALFGENLPCFAKFLYTSRESQSLTAAVKDFGLGSFSTFPVVSVNDEVICEGDSVQLCATVAPGTGVGPFTYLWSTGDTTQCIWVSVTDSHSVVVTGDNGCSSSPVWGSVEVMPTPDLTCAGDLLTCDSTLATASVTVNNSGAFTSLTYLWSPAPVSGQGTATARYDAPGDKKVVVTSAAGCKDSCIATITQDITPPDLTCAGDLLTCDSTLASATVTINNPGELGSVTYVWSPAPVSGQGTNHARYSSPGDKKVVVTDLATGCKDSCTATITQDITAPDLTCAGDLLTCDSTLASATVTINNPGELGSLSYVWSPAPVSGQGTAEARYDAPGDKKVVVTDLATGCKDSCTATITQDITAPDLTCAGDTLTCDSTLASATVSINNPGELGTVSYVWSPAPVSGQGTNHARYDAAGDKKVVVTDLATGCVDS
ncbi:MAG TPA: hypothetical protein VLB27_07810, partial [candidate division Zixibacteria bacterium]|nr:hypothetical protein [candidate division Zixibacteria bacterium]